MKLATYSIQNHTAIFICAEAGTRNGFRHDVELEIDGRPISKARTNYLNRTWEPYEYQTTMSKAVQSALDELDNLAIRQFKRIHGYQKISAKRRAEYEAERRESDMERLLKGLMFAVRHSDGLGGSFRSPNIEEL